MKKLLQILTILVLILSAAALGLGIMLFGKRELLKGRTVALEKGLVQIASLLETPTDPEQIPATFTEKDVGEVAAEEAPEPERAAFWKDYPLYLENADQALVSIRREDLMSYYKMDPVSGRPLKPYQTEGEGTLDAALRKISDAAQYELERLNQTRHRLVAVRAELVKSIEELNDGKQQQRAALIDIKNKTGQIAQLEEDVRQKEAAVAALESEKQTLTDDLAAQEAKAKELADEIQIRDDTIAAQRKKLEELLANKGSQGAQQVTQGMVQNVMEAGRKGRVVSVNQDWSYVVLELDEQALAEIAELREAMTKNQAPGIPTVEMFLKRGDAFVSKIKLIQIKADEKLAIADVLSDWQQMPVVAGDVAFY